jgi:type I restriction-modification system DNA methylase subunit
MATSPTMTPSKTTDIYEVASHLWGTADELRANSHLKAAEYSIPVLGLIFLKFADSRFTEAESQLADGGTGRRTIGKADYQRWLSEKDRRRRWMRAESNWTRGRDRRRWSAWFRRSLG